MIDTNVGWVEERNPTHQSLVFVGFHFVQPNLPIFFIFFVKWYQFSDRIHSNMSGICNDALQSCDRTLSPNPITPIQNLKNKSALL
ncbi:hypothetical protein G7B40_016770 [Aetokthonos hydrillicola Thurmond2011]|uniref:Uncharacterized protein n=2 Tax=Aetokthonos TaxID=1550243 RepID=A0AAP5I9U1_9CYAN|nr:hypothetical protein [Aetokthonos hydrillicola Thurmond2011]